ncbi:MAG: histidine kinase [Rhizobiales bacterium PAR1]|nr:MAG: histidine kinase [Rhizobiales bacterium PAR1]
MPDEPTYGTRTAAGHLPLARNSPVEPAGSPQGLLSLVTIGASAGGLEACQHFLDGMAVGHGLAFILVQHLDPTHPSLMVDLLAGHTAMTVTQAEDGALIAADHLYVIPPGTYLSVKSGMLQLSEPNARHGARLPFDFLLHSVAEAYGKRAQALILSGTGADGSLGLNSIKDQGGYVIAQEPTEAAFDGMPQSAIATGRVDRVLRVADMPSALIRHALEVNLSRQGESAGTQAILPDAPSEAETLARIIALLRQETPHDFTTYKPGTLHRRIRRRMVLAGCANLDAYFTLLKERPAECTLLANDMLINVTAFFRDVKVFALLEKTTIPDLILRHEADDAIRVWVPGCSTGEEAYSIAMLFRDALAALKRTNKLQVFASDVDPDAVATAREGLYAEAAVAQVTPDRLKRYFTKEAHGYRILPELRASMVFTVQDVLSDPPFSRLDFISCRNLLIYLGAEAQESVIALLHFALKPGGVMLLGSAETAGAIEGRFEVISKAERLYRHIGRNRLPEGKTLRTRADLLKMTVVQKTNARAPSRTSYADLCRQAVIESYAPATMLINASHECLFSVGPIARFLNLSAGYPTHDLIDMVPFGLRTRLKATIANIGANKAKIQIEGGMDTRNVPFTVEIQPLSLDGDALFLIAFVATVIASSESAPVGDALTEGDTFRVADLEQQLVHSRAELADAIRTLEQTCEEQKALHEEALSVNEEFQSTNEELLTSKEELQSLNEELTALNNQLHEALERQRSTSNDLQNILYSTHVATLFLDLDLKIRYFTPATRALFHVIPGDIGRPLADLASLAADGALPEEARAVLATLLPVEREVESTDGTWFLRRILPYRADDNSVEGVVITFTNITDRKEIEGSLEAVALALEEAKKQAETANIAKSRFLAAASHDLRQPLQSLTLIQGLLAKNVESDKGRQLVERLDQTLGAITGMMNTLLDINQIEAGTVEAKMIRFPVRDLLERMKDEFQFVAQAQKLDLRVVSSSRVIRSDPHLLEQMIRNLVANALKYTLSGKILLGCRSHAGGLSIEVWDTGIGIAESQLKAIFHEYHQIDNDARERNRGMGLGLAIVQRLGDLLGHHIGVRSHSGRGSVFAIEIAFDPDDVLPLVAPAALLPHPGPVVRTGTLLVVEDDPEVSELLDLHLSGEGHRVTTAKDGMEALERIANTGLRPDVVLADYNLPNGMDGLALAQALREKLGAALPVIILTGDISSETLRMIAQGDATQLNKPVSTADLSAAIQRKLAPENVPEPKADALPAPGGLVFVIDDDAAIRENLGAMLVDAGLEAQAFDSCEAFLADYTPNSGACIVVDAYLPGMSGLDLLHHLRATGNAVPAIMVTGRSDVAIAVEAMKAGAVDFIEKPVRAAGLLASIAHAIEMGQGSTQKRGWLEQAAARVARLTTRQREIMDLVLAGHPNKNIAADLGISQRTVENHRAAIMQKTGSKSLPALARLAFVLSGRV